MSSLQRCQCGLDTTTGHFRFRFVSWTHGLISSSGDSLQVQGWLETQSLWFLTGRFTQRRRWRPLRWKKATALLLLFLPDLNWWRFSTSFGLNYDLIRFIIAIITGGFFNFLNIGIIDILAASLIGFLGIFKANLKT